MEIDADMPIVEQDAVDAIFNLHADALARRKSHGEDPSVGWASSVQFSASPRPALVQRESVIGHTFSLRAQNW